MTNNGPENVPTASLDKPEPSNLKTIINLQEIKGDCSKGESSSSEDTPKIKIDLSGISAQKIHNKEEIKLDRKDSLKVQKAESEN